MPDLRTFFFALITIDLRTDQKEVLQLYLLTRGIGLNPLSSLGLLSLLLFASLYS